MYKDYRPFLKEKFNHSVFTRFKFDKEPVFFNNNVVIMRSKQANLEMSNPQIFGGDQDYMLILCPKKGFTPLMFDLKTWFLSNFNHH